MPNLTEGSTKRGVSVEMSGQKTISPKLADYVLISMWGESVLGTMGENEKTALLSGSSHRVHDRTRVPPLVDELRIFANSPSRVRI